MQKKEYKELLFTDDFLFCKILTNNLNLLKDLLEMILDIPIQRVELAEPQKTMEEIVDGRGIRLDVYVEDDKGTVFDIEMQTTRQKDLPKRTRYYQGMIDMHLIGRGARFAELRKTYIIFLCLDTIFDQSKCIYTFENLCIQDSRIRLDDDAVKVFITPYGDRTGLSNDMIAFLDYLIQKGASSDLTYRIDKEVRKAQTREDWRLDYMTLDMIRQEEREEGWQEGHREGRTETIHQAVQSLMTQEDHLSLEHIKEQIQMMFHLSDTEIKEYLP